MVTFESVPRRNGWLIAVALLFAAVLAVWGQSITFEFVFWDDATLIYENPHVTTPGVSTLSGTWKAHHAGMYIPLVYNLWWGIAQIGREIGGRYAEHGIPPWPFHLANVFVHALNACLVWAIIRQIGLKTWPAIVGALIFALHPLQTEAVCWSTAMKDLLSTALALGSIALCLQAAARWEQNRLNAHLCYAAALLLAFLGSLAKPGILGVPVIAFILDAAFISGWSWRPLMRAAGLAVVLAPAILWTSAAQPAVYERGVSLILRPTVALHALGFYIQKLVVPSQFCIDYGLRPLVVVNHWRHLAVAMIVPAALLLLLPARGHRKHLVVAGIVFVAGVLPVLGLVAFGFQYWSTVSDRYVYLAMLGPAMVVAYLFSLLQRRAAVLAGVAIVCGIGALSARQARVWHDTLSLMDNTIRLNPQSAVAYNNFAAGFCPAPSMDDLWQGSGTTLPTAGPLSPQQKAEIVELADRYFSKAFGFRPEYPDPLKNMIWNRAGRGRYKEAIALSEMALRLGNHDVFGYVIPPSYLGWLYLQERQYAKAKEMLLLALMMDPGDVQAHQTMAELIRQEAAAMPAVPAIQFSPTLEIPQPR